MTSPDMARLPLDRIEAALRKTTEVLASELATPSRTTPDWTDFEWCIAHAAAAMHGVSPLLSSSLRWRGPEDWQRFLDEQRSHTLERHRRIVQSLTEIGTRAALDGIAVTPLKGAALHELGIYQPGERPMSDIDLLVRAADLQATSTLLEACGYRHAYSTWKHEVFAPETGTNTIGFGEHACNPIKIELHTRVMERMPVVARDISALIFPSRPVAGLNGYPSIAALMLHVLTHAAGNMCTRGLRLLHLHDIALLSRRMTSNDWNDVFAAVNGQASWWISPPLTMTALYYADAIPASIVARGASECRWLLRRFYRRRRLCDVSLSNLWIRAFPGIEWASSTQEALRYAMRRVKPDKEVLLGRGKVLELHPGWARFSWTRLPQWRRIARWVFHRPARIETLTCVCAALARPDTQPAITQP